LSATSGSTLNKLFSLRVGVLGILLLLCGITSAAVGSLALIEDDEVEGRRIVYGLTLNPSGFDPHIHISSELGIPFYSVYDTLVYRHPQRMELVPGLAERWEISDDGTSYTFYLRRDVTFHDGTAFDAEAVAANLDRITDDNIDSGKARYLLGPYVDYDILDDYTIRIYLGEPYAPLLDGLSQVYLGIASPAALAQYTKNTYQWHQVGTGPYMLEEFVPGERIILRRNPDYRWGPIFYAGLTPEGEVDPAWEAQAVDVVEFRFYTDPPTRRDALESGEVQVVGELLPTDAELLAGNTSLVILRTAIPGLPQQFFFNMQRAPTDDLAVRRALLYATNRTAIVDAIFQGQSPVAYGPLSSVTPFYAEDVATDPTLAYPHSTDFAQELLAGAGYTDSDGDGWLDRDGEQLSLTMVFADWNQMADVAQVIQSQWRDIGIELDLIQVPDYPTLLDYARDGDFDLIAMYDFGVDASLLNSFYRSDGSRNWSGFSDGEVDEWLTQAVRTRIPEERALYYASAQSRIMEQAVILPVREYVNLHGTSARLDGVIFSAQGWWPLLRNFQLAR
jgi:peptide/nickel transport system substrate-binding protein